MMMLKAMFYKEWLKLRIYYIFAVIASMGFTTYAMIRICRVAQLKGAGHVWEVMLQRDAIFVDLIQFIPMIIGGAIGVAQFAPEIYHKSLKLTLHLPYSAAKLTYAMIGAGMALLLGCSFANFITMNVVLSTILAPELKWNILNTTLVWYTAGLLSYTLASWIILEPTWRYRIANLVVSATLLKVFFLSNTPQAYNSFLPFLFAYTLLSTLLVWLSVSRFKAGKE